MKIKRVDVYLLDTGNFRAKRRPIVCRIHTDEGIYGDGEAGIAYGVGATAAFGMVKDLSGLIIGKDPMNVESIWENMLKQTFWGQGGGAIVYAGMSAIDIALMDIKGKTLNVPCYQLLGGKFRSELRCYASQLQLGWTTKTGPFGKPQEYADIVKHAVSEGYDAVKIDFTYIDRDGKPMLHTGAAEGFLQRDFINMVEERMAAIRNECGSIDLLVENHCRTDVVSALKIGELCDKYDAMVYEEPVAPMNPELHRVIRDRIKTPLASGERIYTRWGYMNFLKNNSIQLIQPDVCNCGGITECKKICDLAHIYDAKVQVHVAGSPVSIAAALQVEAAIPNFCIHEHHFMNTQSSITDLGKYNYQPVNGKYTVPDLPGIGQEISEYAIKTALMHAVIE